MKLLRVGAKGAEKPAILDSDGTIRDLTGIVGDIGGETLTPEGLARIRATDIGVLPKLDAGQRIGPCVANVGKFICIGLNYADHAAETGAPIPAEPIIFMKATSAIIGPNDDVIIPRNAIKP
ncbi:MAG: fumarylacetoacetate hydrolase family protein, partial [Devosia sp.]